MVDGDIRLTERMQSTSQEIVGSKGWKVALNVAMGGLPHGLYWLACIVLACTVSVNSHFRTAVANTLVAVLQLDKRLHGRRINIDVAPFPPTCSLSP